MIPRSKVGLLLVELSNGQRYFTEKKLLARFCNYFARLFQDDIRMNTISLLEVCYDDFKIMVQIFERIQNGYNNTGEMLNTSNVLELLLLSSRFESEALLHYCILFIKQTLKRIDSKWKMWKFKCLEYAIEIKSEELLILLEQHFNDVIDQDESSIWGSFLSENKSRIGKLSLPAQSFILKVVMDADDRKNIRLKFEKYQREGLDKRLAYLKTSLEQKTKESKVNSEEMGQLRNEVYNLRNSVKMLNEKLVSSERDFFAKLEEEKLYRNDIQNRVLDLYNENIHLQEKQKDAENQLFQMELKQRLEQKTCEKIEGASINNGEMDRLLFYEEHHHASLSSKINKLSTILSQEDLQLFNSNLLYPPGLNVKPKHINES